MQKSKSPESSVASVTSDQSTDPPQNYRGHTELTFSHDHLHAEVHKTFRSNLLTKFQCVSEGTATDKSPTLLNEIYTELYITEGDSGEINNEHEVRQIETQSRRSTTEDTPIQCRDIFTALPGQHKAIRTVLTKGVAGIGKTVSVQKFILDWAEEKENQDVQLIFPLPFREINLMKDRTLSLADLLHVFFPETKEMEISRDGYKVLFIFDGLDECRLSLDFNSGVKLCDISESASVEDLLMNLIAGNLLPSALIWITSRPAAADLIPSAFVHRLTEVRGFTDPQKEEYFRKRIRDQRLADEIIQHLKSCRSLFIMCHIPVFCWISATVLEEMMRGSRKGEIPKTLTEMYTHFLIIQTCIRHEKHYEKKLKDEEMILKLGKLAFRQLMKGNLIFYEEDLRECGIDESEASVYSGLCTQIFREELGLFQGKVFCFVHLSIQEHLAALYVLLSFLLYERDELSENRRSKYAHWFKRQTISDLHQRAVDKALQSRNGHLDLFLRFLLGLSLKSNQRLLNNHLTQVGNISYSQEKTVEYIKTQIKMNPSPEKSINLFLCLNELGDHSLVNEVQEYVRSGDLSGSRFSSSQWSAVVFILLTLEQLDEFNLRRYVIGYGHQTQTQKFQTPDKVLQKLLPVVEASRSAVLFDCGISDKGCAALASALRSNSSNLRELDLSYNIVGDSGVKLLSAGLKDPHCKLEKLRLRCCGVSDEGCADLASVLRSNSSNLRELELSKNINVGDSGVKLLSAGLKDPHCKLEKLRLGYCGVSDEGCAALASVLRSNSSNLRELDLSDNKIVDSGVKRLSAGLKDPQCKLETLRLINCDVSGKGCAALASALRSNSSNLRELNLSENKVGDSGVKRLSAGLKDPHCKLEKLTISWGFIC
ncbi:NACHT, LRR and PYD domains-containing protein 3 isoform X3 [Danio rerio]|uniref:NACHT, LRR and PYD domains-containing protein 3 isoform X3 n=2 Tax=Danio rerio TaxID=7955 RepID=A0AC58FZ57_DANRE